MKNKTIPALAVLLQLICCFAQPLSAQTDTAFTRASFPGGERAFTLYWDRNFAPAWKFRVNPPEGEGLLRFDVDEQGNISHIRVLKSLTPDLDKQAVDAAARMPRWQPATLDGKPVASS
ncbi:MAG: energy transducer TonB, partial [Bacteroidota bacterium]